jgi:hypothetical protein
VFSLAYYPEFLEYLEASPTAKEQLLTQCMALSPELPPQEAWDLYEAHLMLAVDDKPRLIKNLAKTYPESDKKFLAETEKACHAWIFDRMRSEPEELESMAKNLAAGGAGSQSMLQAALKGCLAAGNQEALELCRLVARVQIHH